MTVNRNRPERGAPCREVIGRELAPCKRGGRVYFVGAARGPIKIGWTQQPMAARLAALQNGNPERLSVLASIPGGHALESAYHSRFACTRYTGEWFLRTRALMDEIDRLNSPALAAGKLTEAQVHEIRDNPRNLKKSRLAAEHGISRMMVWKIQAGKSWTEIDRLTRARSR